MSNLIMAIFRDTHSLTSGLTFCEFLRWGGRGRDGGLERAGSLEKRPQGLRKSCSEAGQGYPRETPGQFFPSPQAQGESLPRSPAFQCLAQ